VPLPRATPEAIGEHSAPYGRSALDLVVSSYIPTVRALRHARGHPAPTGGAALAVAMPRTPDLPDLPSAGPEAGVVRAAIPDTLVLWGPEATCDRIMAELGGRPWVHFACHGAPNMAVPSAGRLVVHDHREAAFQLAGYAHVIATAWPVWDRVALTFSELCYAELARDGNPAAADDTRIAMAVHTSVRTLRNRYLRFPLLWAAYVHTGV
jgi:CHAT domain-containing protein